ncbi:hypothetical protein NW754_016118 [Fusarium falciforme]|nr:hypothetical protein NW754_016118 [Fusarium falciforme]
MQDKGCLMETSSIAVHALAKQQLLGTYCSRGRGRDDETNFPNLTLEIGRTYHGLSFSGTQLIAPKTFHPPLNRLLSWPRGPPRQASLFSPVWRMA